MKDSKLNKNRRNGTEKKMRRKIIFFIIILLFVSLAAALATFYWGGGIEELFFSGKKDPAALRPAQVAQEVAGERAMLFLPSKKGLTTREITLKGGLHPLEKAEVIVADYLKNLGKELGEARMLGLYRDRGNVLYIDISGDITSRFNGDARDEYLLMKSLWETVARNLSWAADVRLLIDGKERESIGGHLSILGGLKETVERGE